MKILKYFLYQHFFNTCFYLLLIKLLKITKEIKDIPTGNVTLASIISLNFKLYNTKCFSKLTKRIFIPKASKKMRSQILHPQMTKPHIKL